jgi:chromosome segregation protein
LAPSRLTTPPHLCYNSAFQSPLTDVHLKRLQLTGFKTFADRTEIQFSPGVTAIVGPNGSGKSNIADAVLWVLGEQKASAVRGVRNQDVIFNGSAKRKQVGLAEVSLTVDNSDGTLPLAYDEVTVTRRALRSGDSEYYINKTACRLKDIYELFLDTGVGREAYALVNQSEIDAVLTAAPESRRGLFEEAAGIKKYRVKKREAIRKLEATELNLRRITDILAEIEGQLAPLHVQALLARRYRQFKEELNRVEENYLIAELRAADYQLSAARTGRQSDEQLALEFAQQLSINEQSFEALSSDAAKAESALENFRAHHADLRTKNEALHRDRSLSAERLSALTAQAGLHQRELTDLLPRLSAATEQIVTLAAEQEETGELSGSRQRVQNDGEDRLRRLHQQIRELEQSIEKKRKEAETRSRRRAIEEGELARAEARLSEARATVDLLQEEHKRLLTEAASCAAEQKKAEEDAAKTETKASAIIEKAAELRNEKALALERATLARADCETARGEGLSIDVRLKSLLALEESQEGYFAGVKAVTTAVKSGRLRGRYLVVADSFRAPEHLVTALDTAFGSSLQDIITDDEPEAKAAIAYLKQGSYGRATFLPLLRMRNIRADIRHSNGRPSSGFLGPALDLIEFDNDLRPALESLVGRVLICETLDNALELSKTSTGWSRIVTAAGEVIVPSGAITGGSNQRRGGSLLERKAEIQRLTIRQGEQTLVVQRLAKTHADTLAELANAEQRLTVATEESGEFRLRLTASKQQFDRCKKEHATASERVASHYRRIETAIESLRLATQRQQTCHEIIKTLDESVNSDAPDSEVESLRSLTTSRDSINTEITLERIARAALDEKTAGLSRAIQLAHSEAARLSAQKERRLAQIEQIEKDRLILTEQIEAIEAAIVDSDAVMVEANQTQQNLLTLRQSTAAAVAGASNAVRELHNNRANAVSAARKNELAEARLEIVRQQAAMKLLEEYDVTAEFALSLETSPEVSADGPRQVTRLRRELRELGDVNVGAIEEFDRLTERLAYLTAQKDDAQMAKDKVYEAIREIDESTRDVFMATFYAVEVAFQAIFQRLFQGGNAVLKLTSPSDLLETGIEIFVQIPGKKQQNLLLLSGGERALTAVALLFAFLEVRPAPFCLLDEVDAPLDGANIERFADLLRDFGQKTQFLVITHNPATMEAANVWYGVTMQEPGISRVLSLLVPDVVTPLVEVREKIHK